MRPLLPRIPNVLPAESGGWGLVFQAVSSVSLGIVTIKLLLDTLRDNKQSKVKAHAVDENLGPLVRREVERALAAHDVHPGRGR